MRIGLVLLWTLLCSITSVLAQVSVGIGVPGVSIGVNLPVYPNLVAVPGYPVYYAPQMNSNYFFYDGMYWVYQNDNWYASSWYNGPWALVGPEAVPLFVLRVPVRYYRRPPSYFQGWRTDASPRWGEHWGNTWEQSHSGWDTWNRTSVPAPAPLPIYQRQYSGSRYPQVQQQQALQSQNYHYQPRDAVVQQHYQAQSVSSAPVTASQARQVPPQEARTSKPDQRSSGRPPAVQQAAQPAPVAQPPHAAAPREPQAARVQSQDKAPQAKVLTPQSPPVAASPQQQALKAQGQDKPPQAKAVAPQATAQQKSPQPQQVAAHSQPQPPKAQGQDNAPQGKGPASEPKKGQDKGEGKGEQQGGEHNK